jgi:hypothetical protein
MFLDTAWSSWCPVAGFGISGVELSGSGPGELASP